MKTITKVVLVPRKKNPTQTRYHNHHRSNNNNKII